MPGQGLASSVVALDTMVRNMKAMTGAAGRDCPNGQSDPCRARRRSLMKPGVSRPASAADIVILDRHLHVQRVFVGGVPPEADVNFRTGRSIGRP